MLGVDHSLHEGAGLLSLVLQNGYDNVHDIGDEAGETGEDPVHNALSHLLKHVVDVLQEV